MIKTYTKNSQEVRAVQYDGTIETIEEIQEMLKDTAAKFEVSNVEDPEPIRFRIMGKTLSHFIYATNWMVKDDIYGFIVSDDVFKNMFTEK